MSLSTVICWRVTVLMPLWLNNEWSHELLSNESLAIRCMLKPCEIIFDKCALVTFIQQKNITRFESHQTHRRRMEIPCLTQITNTNHSGRTPKCFSRGVEQHSACRYIKYHQINKISSTISSMPMVDTKNIYLFFTFRPLVC